MIPRISESIANFLIGFSHAILFASFYHIIAITPKVGIFMLIGILANFIGVIILKEGVSDREDTGND